MAVPSGNLELAVSMLRLWSLTLTSRSTVESRRDPDEVSLGHWVKNAKGRPIKWVSGTCGHGSPIVAVDEPHLIHDPSASMIIAQVELVLAELDRPATMPTWGEFGRTDPRPNRDVARIAYRSVHSERRDRGASIASALAQTLDGWHGRTIAIEICRRFRASERERRILDRREYQRLANRSSRQKRRQVSITPDFAVASAREGLQGEYVRAFRVLVGFFLRSC